MTRRSTGTPLVIGIVAVLLLLLLAVGWQVLVLGDFDPRPGPRTLDWILLVFGSLFWSDPVYRSVAIGAAIWYALGLVYFAVYGRTRLIHSPEEEFALRAHEGRP